MSCPACASSFAAGSRFCPACGQAVELSALTTERREPSPSPAPHAVRESGLLCRRTWLAVAIHGTLYVLVYAFSGGFGVASIVIWISLWYLVFFRFGWVSILVGTIMNATLNGFPLTTDLSAWHAYGTILVAAVALFLTVYGFKVPLAGRPAFGDLLGET